MRSRLHLGGNWLVLDHRSARGAGHDNPHRQNGSNIGKGLQQRHTTKTSCGRRVRIVAPIPKWTEIERKGQTKTKKLKIIGQVSHVMCQVSGVKFHGSHVLCHLSPVTKANSHIHSHSHRSEMQKRTNVPTILV